MNKSERMGLDARRHPVSRGHGALLLALALGLFPLSGRAETPSPKEAYIQSVITLLRLHSDAIRQLATHDFKYSYNLARHATALHNTFGLLGPMDWHAAEAATIQKERHAPGMKAEDFDRMADQCQKSMKDLYQASIQRMDHGGAAEPVLKALDEVQAQCSNCHDQLNGAAPDVWGKKGK